MEPLGKLIMGIIANKSGLFEKIYPILQSKFGEIDYKSDIIPFLYTDYYEDEMGKNLLRQWISFKKFIKRNEISEVKLMTCKIEKEWSVKGKRSVNLDPGYITLSRLCLASTKDFSHRIYLKDGIFCEVTLIYHKGSFRNLMWTYPDYKANLDVFNSIRKILVEDIRKSGVGSEPFL